jgi:hypothetical protein
MPFYIRGLSICEGISEDCIVTVFFVQHTFILALYERPTRVSMLWVFRKRKEILPTGTV